MKTTRRNILLSALCCISTSMANAQSFWGNYTTEWQWDMNKGTNWVNLLRLEMSVPLWKGGSLEAATLHVAKTGDGIIDDWQGFFNMSQLEYSWHGALYYAGVTLHTRRFVFDDEGEMAPADEAVHKTSCAWWVYGEQPVWKSDGKTITCMAQYSENTCRESGCYRYAEAGGAYTDSLNMCGISGQYAQFCQDNEFSLELTWRRQLTKSIAIQPSFQYINNGNGNFTVLSTRLCCSF